MTQTFCDRNRLSVRDTDFKSVRKLFRVSRNFFRLSWSLLECLKTFPYFSKSFNSTRKLFQRGCELSRITRNIKKYPESFQSVQKLSELKKKLSRVSEKFQGPNTFQSVQKLSKESENFQECPETLRFFWNRVSVNIPKGPEVFQGSRNFPEGLETFNSVWKFSTFNNFFQIVRNLSRMSRKFPKSLEIFNGTQKLSRLSRHFPECPETS